MATFDLKKTEGLRDACREAERRLAESPEMVEKIAKIAEFLQKVQEAPAEERASEAFQRLIWEQNPIYDFYLQTSLRPGLDAALTNPEFHGSFRDITDGPSPEDAQGKATWLALQQTSLCLRFKYPGLAAILTHVTKSYGQIGAAMQCVEELAPENSLI